MLTETNPQLAVFQGLVQETGAAFAAWPVVRGSANAASPLPRSGAGVPDCRRSRTSLRCRPAATHRGFHPMDRRHCALQVTVACQVCAKLAGSAGVKAIAPRSGVAAARRSASPCHRATASRVASSRSPASVPGTRGASARAPCHRYRAAQSAPVPVAAPAGPAGVASRARTRRSRVQATEATTDDQDVCIPHGCAAHATPGR